MNEVKERDAIRAEMIENNMGLVHACAHKFKGKGIEYEDLFQAGCIGLVKACDAFDFSRGVKLSTYAVPVILGEIKRLFRDGGAVKASRSVKELSLKVSRIREQYEKQGDEELSVSFLAQKLEVTPEEIVEALGVSASMVSLTESDENGGGQLDLPTESFDEHYTDIIALKSSMEALDEKDRLLIYLRFYKDCTQTDVSKRLGLTQVQVSRREKKIINLLKEKML